FGTCSNCSPRRSCQQYATRDAAPSTESHGGEKEMGALDGKAIVITGSGRGLGAACAKAVGARGAAVIVNDVDGQPASEVAKAINDAGGRAVAHPADISKWSEAAALIERCV